MSDTNDNMPVEQEDYVPYDARRLSYGNTFTNPFKSGLIRTIEWFTGKIKLLRLIRKFERIGVERDQAFFDRALELMGIPILTPKDQIARIPATGPLIVVANHPHGLVDGMVLAGLIGRVRQDYKILTRNLLTGVPEIEDFMVPVAFPHEEDAIRQNLEMRKIAMATLKAGGCVVLFPSGSVAGSKTWFGPAIEAEWNPFTAKMIQRSGARVSRIYFPGRNTRAYQIANLLSATLRQSLLLHEAAHAVGRPQNPVVGEIIEREELEKWSDNPRGFMGWLRERTLALKTNPDD